MSTKAIIQKYKELVQYLKSQYGDRFKDDLNWQRLESNLSLLQEQGEGIEETVSKEGLPIYDSEESGKELREELIKLLKDEQVQFTYGIKSEEEIIDNYLKSNQ